MEGFGSFGPTDPFSDLLNRFFGMSAASSPPAVQRVPINRLLTGSSRAPIARASQRAAGDGSEDPDTEAEDLLVAHGHRPEFGARPLRRTVRGEPHHRIAEPVLGGAADTGDTSVADVQHADVQDGDVQDGESRVTARHPADGTTPDAA
ncbi:hypothetical protein ACFQ1I_42750 [Kitasatospora arboriphila]